MHASPGHRNNRGIKRTVRDVRRDFLPVLKQNADIHANTMQVDKVYTAPPVA